MERPERRKYSTDELMELVDIFRVRPQTQQEIRRLLEAEPEAPCADPLFRYYSDHSKVPVLEKEWAEKMGASYALGVNSGTSALIAALVAIGVGPGDEVIVPAYTFFASASSIVVARGVPVITEIDESLTLDPEAVEKNITPRTKAILPVHMLGHATDMEAICDIAERHGLPIIEDVAQACGGKYKGKYLGTWGTMACTSLDAWKVIGAGEGGMITTDDEWLYTRAQSWHDAAACWRPDRYAKERRAGELFCGENYRMSEMSAAIALAQLRKLDAINASTRRIYRQLKSEIALPGCARWIEPNDPDGVCGYTLGIMFDSAQLVERAVAAGIGIGGLAGGASRSARDWHVYWYWEQILEQKTPTPEGCPFRCPLVKELPRYSEDMCPRTKDIMTRTGFIDIQPTDTPEWASDVAKRVTEGLAALI